MLTTRATFAMHAFRAMGTDVLLLLEHEPDDVARTALADAERELRRLAAIFTRFDAQSELRRLELTRARRCSVELVEVLDLALDARRRTGGLFDPTVHDALVAAGYDRTFDEVAAAPTASRTATARPGAGIVVDRESGLVALAADASVDLGGIAKGWIADRIAAQLDELAPALVDAGGDIACTLRDGGAPWLVEIADSDLRFELVAGGVASSGIDRRRWIDPATGDVRHHLIDPRTATSASTDLTRVTTIAPTCAEAEVASTAMLLGGAAWLDELAARLGGVPWFARTQGGTWLEAGELR
jgi:thiamine biosynthesis lipoprotein